MLSSAPPLDLSRVELIRRARAKRRLALREERTRCENSLVEFTMRGWREIEPGEFSLNWHHEVIADDLEAITRGKLRNLIVNQPPRTTKALDCDTPILTTWGWKRHGELLPGDFVFGPDGQPKRILGVSERSVQASYRVVFDDGAALVASGDHYWQVERDYPYGGSKGERVRRAEVVTTRNLISSIPGRNTRNPQRPDRIPVPAPISISPRRLLVDPYLLGVWLGDGTTGSANLTVGQDDIDHFRPFGPIVRADDRNGNDRLVYRIKLEGLQTTLRILGLLGNKHIPDDYMEASIEQRWELLRGLMDTDGTATTDGACVFTTKLMPLGRRVATLACSLGIKAHLRETWSTLNGRRFGPYQQVTFRAPAGSTIFKLHRKQDRLPKTISARSCGRYVAAVEYVDDRMVNCIKVEGQIYLAGERFIPTHNTLLVNVFWPAWIWAQPEAPGPLSGPRVRFLCVSYGATLAEEIAVKMRRLVFGAWYQEHWGARVQPAEDQANRSNFANTAGGERMSNSIEGGLLGRGGDCVPGDTIVETARGPRRVDCLDVSTSPEYVLSYDRNLEAPTYRRVVAVARREASTIWRVRTRSGKVVEATGEHRFFTGRGFVQAMAIAVGDVLLLAMPEGWRASGVGIGEENALPSTPAFVAAGDTVSVVERICREEVVYDIQVEGTETFFANGILVHNCQLIDDPHHLVGAESDIMRNATIEAMKSLVTRVTDPRIAARVLVMQRVHEFDATDYALEHWPGHTKHIMLPMRYDPRRAIGEDIRTEDGELLWPEVWDEASVAAEERELGPYGTAGQLQQAPVPRGGGIILRDWWRVWPDDEPTAGAMARSAYRCPVCRWSGYAPPDYEEESYDCPACGSLADRQIPYPPFSFQMISVDTNFGENETDSWSAATAWGIWHGSDEAPRAMLTDAWRGRPRLRTYKDGAGIERQGLVERIEQMAVRRKVDLVLIEKKTRGADLYHELERQASEWPYRLEWFEPTGRGDKSQRLHAVSGAFAGGQVWAPNKAWAETVIVEVQSQPKGRFSDLTDTCSSALIWLRAAGMLSSSVEHRRDVERSQIFRGNRRSVIDEFEGNA